MSIKKNTVWNLAGNVLPLIVGAIVVPFLFKEIGMERFGILTLLWTIIGYFSLFDFGVGRALTQQIASCLGEGRTHDVPQIMKVGIQFTILTGIFGAVVLLLAAYPLSYFGLGISNDLKKEVFISLLIASLGVPLATSTTGLRGGLEAFENFRLSNFARAFLGVSLFLAPAISVFLNGNSLILITVWLVVARFFATILTLWYVTKIPVGRFWSVTIENPSIKKKLLSFGLWMTITNLVSPLLVSLDRFILSFLLGASVIAYYTLPFEFLVRILIVPGAIGASLLPNLAKNYVLNPIETDKKILVACKQTAIVMGVLCVLAALLNYPLLKVFISQEFADKAWLLTVILSVGVFLNGVAYIPYTALHSKGMAKPTAILHVTELLFYVPLLWVLVKYTGLIGAAIAWSLRTAFDCIVLFLMYFKQRNRNV